MMQKCYTMYGEQDKELSVLKIDLGDRIVEVNERSLCAVQALWRGAIVRHQLADVRKRYKHLAVNLEGKGHGELDMAWVRATPCRPKMTRKYVVSSIKDERKTDGNSGVKFKQGVEQSEIVCHDSDTQSSHPSQPKNDARPDDGENIAKDATVSEGVVSSTTSGDHHQKPIESHCQKLHTPSVTKDNGEVRSPPKPKPTEGHCQNLHTPSEGEDNGEAKLPPETKPHSVEVSTSPDVGHATNIHENTSVWDTVEAAHTQQPDSLFEHYTAMTHEALEEERSHVAMELLWVQQAMNSRKQYLRLKSQIQESSS